MSRRAEVCLLGVADDLYTKLVMAHFTRRAIPFDLIIVQERTPLATLPRWLRRLVGVIIELNSGKYRALSKWSLFPYREYLRQALFYRSNAYRSLVAPYAGLRTADHHPLVVSSVNHVKVRSEIRRQGYRIGVLAGVGIVHGDIIGAFSDCCLNAHPAPLPQCRGGGAVQQTLFRKLTPSTSVHYATPAVDAGGILDVTPLALRPDDTLESLSLRLTMQCADRLAHVTERMLSHEALPVVENTGPLNRWSDCTIEVQRAAHRQLKALLRPRGPV